MASCPSSLDSSATRFRVWRVQEISRVAAIFLESINTAPHPLTLAKFYFIEQAIITLFDSAVHLYELQDGCPPDV